MSIVSIGNEYKTKCDMNIRNQFRAEILDAIADVDLKKTIVRALAGCDVEICIQGVTIRGTQEKINNQLIRISDALNGLV